MCGRFQSTKAADEVRRWFGTTNLPNYPANWNAAPTQQLPVVRLNPDTQERQIDVLRWGLVPRWAKDLKIGN